MIDAVRMLNSRRRPRSRDQFRGRKSENSFVFITGKRCKVLLGESLSLVGRLNARFIKHINVALTPPSIVAATAKFIAGQPDNGNFNYQVEDSGA